LVPSFLLVGRLDVVESVGVVLESVAQGVSGVRPAAARLDVPHTTARDWVRRFAGGAAVLWSGFAALTIELGGDVDTAVVVEPIAMVSCDQTVAAELVKGLRPVVFTNWF
jgi:hypothetical protein